mgnify:CR=1 FL=1
MCGTYLSIFINGDLRWKKIHVNTNLSAVQTAVKNGVK